MAFIVIYDANVLYPNSLRDLLIRIAQAGLVQAKWTNEILDETFGALRRNRPEISQDKLNRLRDLVNAAVPDCLVTGYEPLVEGLKLPDANDRHVLAAAIKAGAQVIVTRNLRTSPPAICSRGASKRSRRTTSCSIRSVLTAGPLPHVCGRSQTRVLDRPLRSKTC
jgi:predicted nucleic acid-binding protein